jgi:hypothetical protein
MHYHVLNLIFFKGFYSSCRPYCSYPRCAQFKLAERDCVWPSRFTKWSYTVSSLHCWLISSPLFSFIDGMNNFRLLLLVWSMKSFVQASPFRIQVSLECCLARDLCTTARFTNSAFRYRRKTNSSCDSGRFSCSVSIRGSSCFAISRRRGGSLRIVFATILAP